MKRKPKWEDNPIIRQQFINAIREIIGLDPLYGDLDSYKTTQERFNQNELIQHRGGSYGKWYEWI